MQHRPANKKVLFGVNLGLSLVDQGQVTFLVSGLLITEGFEACFS